MRRRALPGVTFFGRLPVAERDERVGRSHALLVTSTREGWGLVVDEAAAVGTPTFGYNVGGLADSIPAAGGVLTEPSPEELALAVLQAAPVLTSVESVEPWRGAARGWDEVAVEVLNTAVGIAQSFETEPIERLNRPTQRDLEVQYV